MFLPRLADGGNESEEQPVAGAAAPSRRGSPHRHRSPPHPPTRRAEIMKLPGIYFTGAEQSALIYGYIKGENNLSYTHF